MLTCPACLQNTTNTEQTGTYLKCANCGSYFLPAQKNSQEYFNEFYKDSKDIKRSLIRLFIFQGFRLVDWLLHPLAAYSKLNSILLKRRFLNDKRGNILEIGFGLGQNLMR
ncbi:MAG: hypothetical protein KKA19_06595, partial [Candidatus Margulisbacteria bacterium]|nr:hypothetical protein [Candidatus Margulisiibacteriota bacterium]